ncbi:Predicted thiol-disulfide oxidoreductase YuxK, DCC family [Meinhardsimonia xiamenensis]|jgi:predicted DCC family thiol-disulfide oxidoreductase YuxK|uniref:Predicted thiol-disulfide oxidoreductase YuxK, DCC family n=1 Tax=Meinhardsimonia xiamenensis TaxID=990712 RepID=A0A1G9GHN1_9RHOB|nr:DUF393 domain-containing protein [Meinhardsimonia xiamenensis]PRX31880.1 putative DCC family thiol-disulfide oxidoreductase YuxK [Meinhardsimonia xiamenensis]SDL00180.1 Predicted thiol-disulfide oxidoreductase YuxK, DCC family [Meinhardsimonia xiamenensis]
MRTPSAAEAAQQAPELTVFFDGACPLCRAEMDFWRRQPGAERIAFVDVARDDTVLPRGVGRAQARARFHVETAERRVISGAAAFLALIATLPRLRWLARIGRLPGIAQLLELSYRLFLRLRPALVAAHVRLRRHRSR